MIMKKIWLSVLILCSGVGLCGCSQELPPASILRDEARVGGTLSFVYDKNEKMVFVGGEGEVLQYSSADEMKGLEEGNRFGLKVSAPDVELDLSSASLEMNEKTYSADEFLEKVEGASQRQFYLYPLFSKDNKETKFSITWQEGTKKQCYEVLVNEGTKFMNKDGSVE